MKELRLLSYSFQIKLGNRVVHSLDNVVLGEPTDAWGVIAELSVKFATPGHRVLVKDEHGSVVIMAGLVGAKASATKVAA